jgi:inner membrane protein
LPTIMTHVLVGGIAAASIGFRQDRLKLGALAVCCAALPDADVIGFAWGVHYADFWGHRGFFHSPFFAFLLSAGLVLAFFNQYRPFSEAWWKRVLFLTVVGASHGLLDALTDGGLGIALMSPASNARYFFPWTPIRVSPIGMQRFFTARGMEVLVSEMIYVWAPLVAFYALQRWARFWLEAHSARRASMGSRRAACKAGSTPAERPIKPAKSSEKIT